MHFYRCVSFKSCLSTENLAEIGILSMSGAMGNSGTGIFRINRVFCYSYS